uniref:Uncharacterized protein n=1 Tax=Florenciella sp. virus SA2 TaxID=3240092 RepID=A0AB39JDY4_9VIRU
MATSTTEMTPMPTPKPNTAEDANTSYNKYMDNCVQNAINFIKTDQEMIDYVKNFDGPDGFSFTQHPIIDRISDAVANDGHSGSSFAICLRICQEKLIAE